MKTLLEMEHKAPLNAAPDVIERLQEALSTGKPPIKAWLIAQIEAALSEIPFREATITPLLTPPKETAPNRLLTPQEASQLLNIPVRWIYRHTTKLPHRRFGRYIRFPEKELLKWIEKQQARAI